MAMPRFAVAANGPGGGPTCENHALHTARRAPAASASAACDHAVQAAQLIVIFLRLLQPDVDRQLVLIIASLLLRRLEQREFEAAVHKPEVVGIPILDQSELVLRSHPSDEDPHHATDKGPRPVELCLQPLRARHPEDSADHAVRIDYIDEKDAEDQAHAGDLLHLRESEDQGGNQDAAGVDRQHAGATLAQQQACGIDPWHLAWR
mmetsp:Transcript_85969/g.221344  ORF Transcript_85969/g.221344 Transcript_85969/m.221344 type:complete len:206 (-) Transcript_85969:227-844(-)